MTDKLLFCYSSQPISILLGKILAVILTLNFLENPRFELEFQWDEREEEEEENKEKCFLSFFSSLLIFWKFEMKFDSSSQ